jgi:hypothetical protein
MLLEIGDFQSLPESTVRKTVLMLLTEDEFQILMLLSVSLELR